MCNKLAPLRGMKDILPEEHNIHEYIENTARHIASLYGYENITTPIIEDIRVFDRSLGATSDVISKEVYAFHDKSNRLIALRPEFTASIIRAFISNNLSEKIPLKLFSSGALFRYDRPKLGRNRQFYQLNFEHIGADDPFHDAEIIKLAVDILTKLEVMDDLTLELNSLGCPKSRASYQESLFSYFSKYKNDLSDDSKNRLEKNPLRILDSKSDNDQQIAVDAPMIQDFYTDSAREYFDQVLSYLNLLNVKYNLNSKLVRGLDYYSHTAFEFTTTKLGTQTSIAAGGRYDELSQLLGGNKTPAIGFAIGFERLMLLKEFQVEQKRNAYIIPLDNHYHEYAIKLLDTLRQNNISAMIDLKGKVSKRLQKALSKGARYAIFIGEDEVKIDSYTIKDLDNKTEQRVKLDSLISILDILKQ